MNYPEPVLQVARYFIAQSIYSFSDVESQVLKRFFTNIDKRVFFLHTFPTTAGSTLMSMYSRMKNTRGLRGTFVDQFLPEFLATELKETEEQFDGNGGRFLKSHGINSLEAFINHSSEAYMAFREFMKAFAVDAGYITRFAAAEKVKRFLKMYLDKYGHNSIARTGTVYLCAEQISILAAKSFEWGRPGAAYIELSTRFVDESGAGVYPIDEELEAYGISRATTRGLIDASFGHYRDLQGKEFTGTFPSFMRERYAKYYEGVEADFKMGIIGETCDVLGNFLPACTLTSMGCAISGEALPELVKHLCLDGTPENITIAEWIVEEGKKLGFDQFMRHLEPTLWKASAWEYLDVGDPRWKNVKDVSGPVFNMNLPPRAYVEQALLSSFRFQEQFRDCITWKEILTRLSQIPRGEFDKLPNHFEGQSAEFGGVMSFRGWRDLQRMSFCAHYRTLLTPLLGFYVYDKPSPPEFHGACGSLHSLNMDLYREMTARGVPKELRQYPLALGNLVGFLMIANFSQLEFCNWQRTNYSVNHEVRRVFLGMETRLREAYPWWQELSEMAKPWPRADMTPAYVFARGSKEVPLTK